MAFVTTMILFDVKDYRLLYGSISLSSEKCSSIDVFGTKARMDTYRI